ncbi:MAG: TetR family transcriptional regulator [Myxococcales bacterium]|nr:TetR family transcriptional regulator [Myxococcales bacterium]
MTGLDTDRIAKAALAVVTERGVRGFTMRAVADALDVTPMALYHHVKDKAELAALVVDAALRARPLPPPTGDWQEDLWAMALWMRQSTTTPALARLRREYQVWTPSMLRMTERWLSLWQQSGLDLDKAVVAATASSMAITGVATEEPHFRAMKLPDDATLAMLPNARLVFEREYDSQAQYELVVRSLIAGLHARLSRADALSAQTKSTTRKRRPATGKNRVRRNR